MGQKATKIQRRSLVEQKRNKTDRRNEKEASHYRCSQAHQETLQTNQKNPMVRYHPPWRKTRPSRDQSKARHAENEYQF